VIPSTLKRHNQAQLTAIFAKMADKHVSQIANYIWNNPKNPDSLRLSLSGYNFIVQELKINSYKFEISPPLTNKNLLQLERYYSGMYFILANKFVVFDEQDASMLNLINGDLQSHLRNLEQAHNTD
jgi:hypothetical protein